MDLSDGRALSLPSVVSFLNMAFGIFNIPGTTCHGEARDITTLFNHGLIELWSTANGLKLFRQDAVNTCDLKALITGRCWYISDCRDLKSVASFALIGG